MPDGQVATHEEKKKAKRKIALEVLKVDNAKDQPALVSCRLDTAHKTVTFQFAPDSDKPSVIAEKLLAENCLAPHHVAIVEDQLEQIIDVCLVNKGNPRVVGTKLTTVVETQTTTTTSNLSSGPPTARAAASPAPPSAAAQLVAQGVAP
ncbi:unnamed protein product, partial [Cylicostephanus goldi]